MWGFGCILYELLKFTLLENKGDKSEFEKQEFKKERFLFQGTSCFPLTPVK